MRTSILALTTSLVAVAGPALAADAGTLRSLSGEAAVEAFRSMNFELAETHAMSCGTQESAVNGGGSTEDLLALLQAEAGRAAADGDDPNGALRTDLGADGVSFRETRLFTFRERTQTPVIFLDFDPDEGQTDTFEVDFVDLATGGLITTFVLPDYVFSDEDRTFIRDRIAADLEPYGYEVVTEEPASGPFTEIDFANNDRVPGEGTNVTLFLTPTGGVSFSILFGRADEIDFGDDNLDSGAFTDTSFWVVLQQLFTAGSFEALSGITPADTDGDGLTDFAAVQEAVRNQGANTGVHEAGHTLGLRHHDSFGPIGSGLPTTGTPAPSAFIPTYTGLQEADETILNIMATGASVALPIQNSTTVDRVFSQRSNLKLRLANGRSRLITEEQLSKTLFGSGFFKDVRFLPPITAISPFRTLRTFDDERLDSFWVQGSIDGPEGADTYGFFAFAGEQVTAEIISFTDTNIALGALLELNLFELTPYGDRILVASNNQTFEPFDPLIVDFEVPRTGKYVVEVSAPDRIFLDLDGDGVIPDTLSDFGLDFLLDGDYDLLLYKQRAPFETIFASLFGK